MHGKTMGASHVEVKAIVECTGGCFVFSCILSDPSTGWLWKPDRFMACMWFIFVFRGFQPPFVNEAALAKQSDPG
jgi:hypothetical protein